MTDVPNGEAQSLGLPDAIVIRASTRTYYTAGGAAGIVTSLASMFILLFYSTALGVPAGLVGTALAVALVFDALSDPIVGYLSDKHRSRWGRRHPFMYFAILPVTILLYALWNPPHELLGPQGLFFYLLATIIPLRLLLTFFEVPSLALVPELTTNYDERTRLATYRVSLSWLMITGFAAALYGYWLRNTPEHPNGLMNPAGYGEMGSVAALVVCAAMLLCAVGLHPLIPKLRKAPEDQRWNPRDLLEGMRITFTEPALVPLLAGCAMVLLGFNVYGAFFTYVFAYFWELSPGQLSGTMLAWGLGVCLGFLAPPLLARIPQKRMLAIGGLLGMCVSAGGPVALGLAGLFPEPGSSARYPLLCFFLLIDMLTFLAIMGSLYSMIADVAERRELASGQREEGAIFAAQTLILKISSALGVWIAGFLLEWIRFPSGSDILEVPAETIRNLGLVWIGANVSCYLLACLALMRFRMTRGDHAEHIEELARRTRASGT